MTGPQTDRAWAIIEEERLRDKALRRMSRIAWTVSICVVVIYGALTAIGVAEMMKGFMGGMLPLSTAAAMATPFLIALGIVSVLIATVTTIGSFMRLRTASLQEIQLRLAALEEMVASRLDTK